jgi:GGDEF domain-containing protein
MTFSHDGLRDSLTMLAAPPYFYENLRRELATAERNRSRFTLIRFQLFPRDEQASLASEESQYELAILSFAEVLKTSVRAEDLCARLGRFEFTVILKAPLAVAESLTSRVVASWSSHQEWSKAALCKSEIVTAKIGESSLEILNRLDNQELIGITQS